MCYQTRMSGLYYQPDGGATFELGDEAIRRSHAGGMTQMELRDVTRVRIGTLGRMGMLELTARDGRKLVVASEHEPSDRGARYRGFVEELHRRLLASGGSAEYVGGVQIGPALGAIAGVALLALALTNPMHFLPVRIYLMYGIGAFSTLAGIALTLKNRKRFYDPLAIPRHLMPS